jgi:N6-L-threonylcarbamoyladenine synthase/protein kinase Bud32
MLGEMCGARGAEFFAPEARFLRDNAGMIAVLGARMYEAGDTLAVEDSRVLPDFRPDEVPVTWRQPASPVRARTGDGAVRGAEALVEVGPERVTKRRVPKPYRHPALDGRLRSERTRSEARTTSEARRLGVPTPVVFDVDVAEATLVFEIVGESDLRDDLTESGVRDVGRHLATLHGAGLVHGDPTPRNVRVARAGGAPRDGRAGTGGSRGRRVDSNRTYLIDFGLGYYSDDREDYAMDLHVFERSLSGTADDPERLCEAVEAAYREAGDPRVVEQLREIEGRGRYQ